MPQNEVDLNSAVSSTPAGTLIRLHVQPKARRRLIVGLHDGRLKLCVTAPADRGRANAEVIELLAESLDLPPSAIQLIRGETSRKKDVLIPNQDCVAVQKRLHRSLPSA